MNKLRILPFSVPLGLWLLALSSVTGCIMTPQKYRQHQEQMEALRLRDSICQIQAQQAKDETEHMRLQVESLYNALETLQQDTTAMRRAQENNDVYVNNLLQELNRISQAYEAFKKNATKEADACSDIRLELAEALKEIAELEELLLEKDDDLRFLQRKLNELGRGKE